jgi:hypothetical protein
MGLRLDEGRASIALAQVDILNHENHLADAELVFEECGSGHGLAEVARVRSEQLTPTSA